MGGRTAILGVDLRILLLLLFYTVYYYYYLLFTIYLLRTYILLYLLHISSLPYTNTYHHISIMLSNFDYFVLRTCTVLVRVVEGRLF